MKSQKSSQIHLENRFTFREGLKKHLLDMVFEGFWKTREVMPRCLWLPCINIGIPINEIRVGSCLVDSKASCGETPVLDLVNFVTLR